MTDVEIIHSEDKNEIFIKINEGLPINNLIFILEFLEKLGYKYWLPNNELGYSVFAKEIK